jgi:hypothetical protein
MCTAHFFRLTNSLAILESLEATSGSCNSFVREAPEHEPLSSSIWDWSTKYDVDAVKKSWVSRRLLYKVRNVRLLPSDGFFSKCCEYNQMQLLEQQTMATPSHCFLLSSCAAISVVLAHKAVPSSF